MGLDIETIFDIVNEKDITEIEFIGIDSGDYEAHCFDVDKDTFINLTGKEPSRRDKSYFNDNTYRYYPFDELDGKKYKVKIVMEEV